MFLFLFFDNNNFYNCRNLNEWSVVIELASNLLLFLKIRTTKAVLNFFTKNKEIGKKRIKSGREHSIVKASKFIIEKESIRK